VQITLFLLCAAVIAVAQLVILRSMLSPRAARSSVLGASTSRRTVEIVWVTLPAVVLAAVLWLTWRDVRTSAQDTTAPAHDSHLHES
jgi:hypothetical protein